MKRKRKVRNGYSFSALRLRAFHAQKERCYWCKEQMHRVPDGENDPLQLTGDHLVPLYAGGKTIPGNIVAACKRCNNSRNSETNRTPTRVHDKTTTWGDPKSYSPFEVLKVMKK